MRKIYPSGAAARQPVSRRRLPAELTWRKLPWRPWSAIAPELDQLGEIAGGELYSLQLADRENEPTLVQWDAWGNRIDRIEVTPLWRRGADRGGRAWSRFPTSAHGRYSRIHQFAAVYLFHPSSDVYTCPLAMTDGAARTLTGANNAQLIERAVPRLTSRDPAQAWTSGQWMTESTGGSDVGASLTRARSATSTVTGACTARSGSPRHHADGAHVGASGRQRSRRRRSRDVLCRDARRGGTLNGMRVERLKDKLRASPDRGAAARRRSAELVSDTRNGTRNIEPMLVVTRAWNSVTSVAFMRRGLALARLCRAAARVRFDAQRAAVARRHARWPRSRDARCVFCIRARRADGPAGGRRAQ